MSSKAIILSKKQTQQQPKRKANSKKRSKRAQRRNKVVRQALSTESLHIKRKELWTSISIPQGQDNLAKIHFDTVRGPVWFKAISKLYEQYQIHNIRFFVEPSSATTTNGRYVCSFNTNYDEREDARTENQLANQLGACKGIIFRKSSGYIPASAIKGFRTNIPLRSDHDGWAFNIELFTTGVSAATALTIYIEYDITLRGPQC